MRTTLTLGDDVYRAARNLATAKHVGIGEAVTELARRGLRQDRAYSTENDLPVFTVSESAEPFGLEDVALAEEEDDSGSILPWADKT